MRKDGLAAFASALNSATFSALCGMSSMLVPAPPLSAASFFTWTRARSSIPGLQSMMRRPSRPCWQKRRASRTFSSLRVLRADYYGQLQADAALFPSTQRIDIPPLQADRLETVIRRPAEQLGARFDLDEMPHQIAAATLNEPGALPLLSYLMSDMWAAMQERADGILRWSERPEVIDIAAPLRARAERYRSLNPAKESALCRLFTFRLAHIPRQGEPVRRRARKAECKADEWEIAETLAGSDWRLLTLHAPEGWEPAAEVAHEQLLRKWPTLTRWLEAQREFLIWKGEIEADRRECEKLPEAEREGAFLSGRRLLRAQQWLESHGEDLPDQDRAFIVKSIDRAEKARLED